MRTSPRSYEDILPIIRLRSDIARFHHPRTLESQNGQRQRHVRKAIMHDGRNSDTDEILSSLRKPGLSRDAYHVCLSTSQ